MIDYLVIDTRYIILLKHVCSKRWIRLLDGCLLLLLQADTVAQWL